MKHLLLLIIALALAVPGYGQSIRRSPNATFAKNNPGILYINCRDASYQSTWYSDSVYTLNDFGQSVLTRKDSLLPKDAPQNRFYRNFDYYFVGQKVIASDTTVTGDTVKVTGLYITHLPDGTTDTTFKTMTVGNFDIATGAYVPDTLGYITNGPYDTKSGNFYSFEGSFLILDPEMPDAWFAERVGTTIAPADLYLYCYRRSGQ